MTDPQSSPGAVPTPEEAQNPVDDGIEKDSASTAGDHEQFSTGSDVQAVIAERDDYKDKWARARADLENYRRRIQREMEEDRKFACIPLLKAVLPGLDGLQFALKAASTTQSAEELMTGVGMVVKQFETGLASLGIQTIPADVGLPFDPNVHEAISQFASPDHPPMTVLQEVERGYTLHERVIRPAKVIVSSNG